MRFILVFIGVAFSVFVVLAIVGGGRNSDIVSACLDGSIDATKIIESWKTAGVIRSVNLSERNAIVEVVTRRWEGIEPNAKITIGLAAFCSITDKSGKGFVSIEGNRMEKLGSVVDGHWSN